MLSAPTRTIDLSEPPACDDRHGRPWLKPICRLKNISGTTVGYGPAPPPLMRLYSRCRRRTVLALEKNSRFPKEQAESGEIHQLDRLDLCSRCCRCRRASLLVIPHSHRSRNLFQDHSRRLATPLRPFSRRPPHTAFDFEVRRGRRRLKVTSVALRDPADGACSNASGTSGRKAYSSPFPRRRPHEDALS